MLPTLLTYDACIGAMSWPAVVEALRRGHRLPRAEQGDLLLGGGTGQLLNRAARIEGLGFAIKGDSIFPQNAAKGLPSVQGAVLLYDGDTGAVRAVIESRLVTQFKTAADSVLGALCLARADSRNLLIVGGGVVAETLARAYDAAFPALTDIAIWSRRPEQATAIAAKLGDLRCNVMAVPDLPQAVGQADIVSCATMAQTPVILGEWVRPGTHVDLIGAYNAQMREADDALIAGSLVYVDCIDTVIDHIGELMLPIAAGVVGRDHVRGDLYDLVAANGSSRWSDDQITLFKNGGGAHLDLMVSSHIVDMVSRPN